MKTATVLGGTGVFGGRIAAGLAATPGIGVRIASRGRGKGEAAAKRIGAEWVRANAAGAEGLARALEGADLLVNAAGPFQGQDYRVAEACIEAGVHYLDIADGREFVCGITVLDAAARERGVVVGSGASSVPAVTSAMVGRLAPEFAQIDRIEIALSPGNQNPRGASTVGGIFSYLGRPVRVFERRRWTEVPGWGDRRLREFPAPVGRRLTYACDVPDLDLFPAEFGADTVRFHAGLELNLLNHKLHFAGMLRRVVPMPWLPKLAGLAARMSLLLYPWGSKNGALAVWAYGRGEAGGPVERRIAIVTDDDGPATPSAAAILLGRRVLVGEAPPVGAYPCNGILSMEEIAAHLGQFGVWVAEGDESGWEERAAPRQPILH